jgi:lysophospholipase L1-like esterase
LARTPNVPDKATILFQGDSITDAGRDRSTAHPNVAWALGTGYPLLVASALLHAYPERGLTIYNRGVSGNKVPELEARWNQDTIALAPDVVSVLVGVNDYWHTRTHGYTGTVEDYERQYGSLLDEARRRFPSVRLVVLEPFVLQTGNVDATWWPAFDARRAAAARAAERAGARGGGEARRRASVLVGGWCAPHAGGARVDRGAVAYRGGVVMNALSRLRDTV